MDIKYIIIILICSLNIQAQVTSNLKGQLSGWADHAADPINQTLLGIRYLPNLSLTYGPIGTGKLDTEVSLNITGQTPVSGTNNGGSETSNFGTYRGWIRYYTDQYEIRAGLQKISFGPAKVLRSLMWFDSVDPTDPFKLTDAVTGLLYRYYFLDNSNVWMWGLYGTGPEYGARYQFKVPLGELGISMHNRQLDKTDWVTKMSVPIDDGTETKVGIDGIWDVGIGLWFEAVATETKIKTGIKSRQTQMTIGADYTFKPGIHVTLENYVISTGAEFGNLTTFKTMSAAAAEYPINLIDSINVISMYDKNSDKIFCFTGWQRTYDNWQFNLLAQGPDNKVQFIVTYNH
jgi:hypothetical protein